MRMHRVLILLALFVALAAAPVFAGPGCSKHAEAAAETAAKTDTPDAHSCGDDCTSCTVNASKYAEGAANGCQASYAALVEMAKQSGDEKAIMLATRAEGGCEHSRAELIEMVRTWSENDETVSMAVLAVSADKGCAESTAKLIEMAKVSEDQKLVSLATRAEGGCEHSKQELIATAQKTDSTTLK